MGRSMAHETEKIYDVKVAPTAYRDLNSHFYFLARVSEPAAERLKNTLLKDIRSLEKMPGRGAPYERRGIPQGKYRYLLSADRYRIVYYIAGDIVRVNGIEDCRMENVSEFH